MKGSTETTDREERIAICVESGVDERRAVAIADCEEREGDCTCGAGHRREGRRRHGGGR